MGCLGMVDDCKGEVCSLVPEDPSVVRQHTDLYVNTFTRIPFT